MRKSRVRVLVVKRRRVGLLALRIRRRKFGAASWDMFYPSPIQEENIRGYTDTFQERTHNISTRILLQYGG